MGIKKPSSQACSAGLGARLTSSPAHLEVTEDQPGNQQGRTKLCPPNNHNGEEDCLERPLCTQPGPRGTRSGLGRWLQQEGVLFRGLSLHCSPPSPPQAWAPEVHASRNTSGARAGSGTEAFSFAGHGLPPYFLSGWGNGGKGLHIIGNREGNPNVIRMASLEERKWSGGEGEV